MENFYWKEFVNDINSSVKNGDRVLDAGAGDRHWKKMLPDDIEYIAMDLGVGDIEVDYSGLDIKGDLNNIPLKDHSIDIVICIQVLEHVKEPWKVIEEFYRILKPGGILFLTCPQSVPLHQEPYDFFRFTKYGLQYLLERSKFKVQFIIAQLGTVHKISNDIKILSNEFKSSNKNASSFFLRLISYVMRKFLLHHDMSFLQDTTGYFTKAFK